MYLSSAAGVRAQQQHVHQPHPTRRDAAPQLHASGSKTAPQEALASAPALQQMPSRQPLDTGQVQQSDTAQPATREGGHSQHTSAVVSPAGASRHGADFVDNLQPGVQRNAVSVAHGMGEAGQQGVNPLSSPTDAAPVTQPSVASPKMQAQPRSVPQPKRKRKQSFVEGF